MKKIIILLVLILSLKVISAQQSIKVLYALTHVLDTLNKNDKHKEDFALIINSRSSRFVSVEKLRADSINKVNTDLVERGVSANYIIEVNKGTRDEIFNFITEKKLYKRTRYGYKAYAVALNAQNITWELVPTEFKNILGKKCNKAIGVFGGRKYIVWYTTQIPTTAGPWKLRGLPGLILQAIDVKNEVFFVATAINTSYKNEKIELTKNDLLVQENDFLKLQNANAGKSPIQNSDFKIDGIKLEGTSTTSKPKTKPINNPLEVSKNRF